MKLGSSQKTEKKRSRKSKKNTESQSTARTAQGLNIDAVEEKYNAKYVGQYDLPSSRGPYLIFYVENPDTSKGHDNYFALRRGMGLTSKGAFGWTDSVTIFNGKGIRDSEWAAILLEDDTFLVSRWHHDYVTGPRGEMLDGGSDYTRYNLEFPPTHKMKIIDGKEVFTPVPPREPKVKNDEDFENLDLTPEQTKLEDWYGYGLNGVSGIMYDVGEFHLACDQPVRYKPALPTADEAALRLRLITEEFEETKRAIETGDIVEVADGLADLIYVIAGTALVYGLPLDEVWSEVHDSNMAKVDPETGKVLKRADGKILKRPGWTPPDIKTVLGLFSDDTASDAA